MAVQQSVYSGVNVIHVPHGVHDVRSCTSLSYRNTAEHYGNAVEFLEGNTYYQSPQNSAGLIYDRLLNIFLCFDVISFSISLLVCLVLK